MKKYQQTVITNDHGFQSTDSINTIINLFDEAGYKVEVKKPYNDFTLHIGAKRFTINSFWGATYVALRPLKAHTRNNKGTLQLPYGKKLGEKHVKKAEALCKSLENEMRADQKRLDFDNVYKAHVDTLNAAIASNALNVSGEFEYFGSYGSATIIFKIEGEDNTIYFNILDTEDQKSVSYRMSSIDSYYKTCQSPHDWAAANTKMSKTIDVANTIYYYMLAMFNNTI